MTFIPNTIFSSLTHRKNCNLPLRIRILESNFEYYLICIKLPKTWDSFRNWTLKAFNFIYFVTNKNVYYKIQGCESILTVNLYHYIGIIRGSEQDEQINERVLYAAEDFVLRYYGDVRLVRIKAVSVFGGDIRYVEARKNQHADDGKKV